MCAKVSAFVFPIRPLVIGKAEHATNANQHISEGIVDHNALATNIALDTVIAAQVFEETELAGVIVGTQEQVANTHARVVSLHLATTTDAASKKRMEHVRVINRTPLVTGKVTLVANALSSTAVLIAKRNVPKPPQILECLAITKAYV
eukprot:PhF_6_TR7850/c0_g1_i2/m.11452